MAPTDPSYYQASELGARVENLETSSTVSQRLIILEGRAGGTNPPILSSLISRPDPRSGFSSVQWEVNHGYFKALVQLTPGSNDIILDYFPQSTQSSTPITTHFNLHFQPSLAPPLHLAILIASDSPALVNDGRVNQSSTQQSQQSRGSSMFKRLAPIKNNFQGGNRDGRPIVDCPQNWRRQVLAAGGLTEVKRRFAIQAYLWQAFHSEQMRRHQLGSRAFNLDDSSSDPPPNSQSSTSPRTLQDLPKIHILKSRHSLKDFRDPNNAQQFKGAKNGGAMHQFAMEALKDPSVPRQLHHSPVAVLVLDSTWDCQMKLLRGHAAVGSGGAGQTSVGVMGSHWLWSAPSSLEQVTPAFLDEEPTDENCCVNDLNECSTAWETLNIGSGAFMHEVGHALDNPHWPSGLMARGYVDFNRAFMTRSPKCSRSRTGPISPVNSSNDSKENHLHRAQAIRARWHPCCRLPSDPYLPFLQSGDPQVWREWNEATPNWNAGIDGPTLRCSSGIACVEIEVNDQYRTHIEFTGLENGRSPPSTLQISPSYLGSLVGFDPLSPASKKVMLRAVACNMRQSEMKDYRAFGFLKEAYIAGFTSSVVKTMFAGQEGSRSWSVPIQDLRAIEIFSGGAFDGLRFHSNSSPPLAFGPLGGGSPSLINLRPGDTISKIVLRAGAWIDAIDIHFSSGSSTGMRGNLSGGSIVVLEPPEGYFIQGVYGSSNQWVTSMGLICSRLAGFSAPQPQATSAPTSRGLQQQLAPGEVILQQFGDQPVLPCEEVGGEGKDQLLARLPSNSPYTIEVFAGAAFDGLQLHASSSPPVAFGPLGGSSKGSLEVDERDRIVKVELRAGAWIDGIHLHLLGGKSSGWLGNAEGGSLKVLKAPDGYEIVGFRGTASNWVHSFGLVCSRIDSK